MVLDLEPTGQTDAASLTVVGIEDLIAQRVGCWLRDGAPSGELVARLQALVGLGREGVGGPLGASYLHRRLARETNGEVIVEMLRLEEGRAQIRTPRTTGLTQMHRRISAWRDHCGLLSDPLRAANPGGPSDVLTGPVRSVTETATRSGEGGSVGPRRRSCCSILRSRRHGGDDAQPMRYGRKAIMTSLRIRLEARSSARRCHRAYEVAVSTDLFGAWLVEMSYGRIGALGRTKARSFLSADDAAAQVKACLRKRASAPRRISVAYRVRSAVQCGDWRRYDLEERLCAWFPRSGDCATKS